MFWLRNKTCNVALTAIGKSSHPKIRWPATAIVISLCCPQREQSKMRYFNAKTRRKTHRALALFVSCFRLLSQMRKRKIFYYQYHIFAFEREGENARTWYLERDNIASSRFWNHDLPTAKAKSQKHDIWSANFSKMRNISRFRVTNIVFSHSSHSRWNAILIATDFASSRLTAKAKTRNTIQIARERIVFSNEFSRPKIVLSSFCDLVDKANSRWSKRDTVRTRIVEISWKSFLVFLWTEYWWNTKHALHNQRCSRDTDTM